MGLRHHGLDGPTFQMRQKVFAIGDDFWIEDSGGNKVYKVNGKAARLRNTFILEDPQGNQLSRIQEKKLSVRDKMSIESGSTKAIVRKLIGIRDHYIIEADGGEQLKAHGNIVDHEYEIERDGDKIAEVSKKWFRLRDTYGVQLAQGQGAALRSQSVSTRWPAGSEGSTSRQAALRQWSVVFGHGSGVDASHTERSDLPRTGRPPCRGPPRQIQRRNRRRLPRNL